MGISPRYLEPLGSAAAGPTEDTTIAATTKYPTRTDLLWFGLIVFAVFGVLGAVARFRFGAPDTARVLWSVGAGLALVYYAVPPIRHPAYAAWMKLFSPVGWLVSNGVLVVVFYGLVTPMGLIMRAFGRDKLARRLDRDAPSYWSEHDPSSDANRYFRQT